jgi:hypothetical protein
MARSITTKEAAKLLREGLKNEFPGVKFSVTMGRGTASAWIDIHYTDGPTEAAVRDFAFRYQGAQFNGMTDSYDPVDSRLIAFDGKSEPEDVHFLVDGIIEKREYSPAAWLHTQSLIADAGYPETRCTATSTPPQASPARCCTPATCPGSPAGRPSRPAGPGGPAGEGRSPHTPPHRTLSK